MNLELSNYINGQKINGKGEKLSVDSPITEKILGEGNLANKKDINHAVEAAEKAYQTWGKLTLRDRSKILYNYRNELIKNKEELAQICHIENGKSITDAYAGVDKAVELVEYACSLTNNLTGKVQNVSQGIECKEIYKPLGVCASITPYNFPIMVPHWTIPIVLALGNTMILKPSEATPFSALKIAELFKKAGLPDGVLNVIIGAQESVEAICDHPKIKAVSFVGSTPVAEIVYKRASNNLKRVNCFGGAKNNLIVMPDANIQASADDIIASFSGMTGQRCMAASVLIAVGDSKQIIDEIISKVEKIKLGEDMAPMLNKAAIQNIEKAITTAEKKGAKVLVDGRNFKKPNQGYYIGPTIIEHLSVASFSELEIFGPTLEIIKVNDLSEALTIENNSTYGNACAIFTQSGRHSNEMLKEAQAGMLGTNIGIPVPRDPFSFGGLKGSHFGYCDITGDSSIYFWSSLTKATTKWNPQDKKDWTS